MRVRQGILSWQEESETGDRLPAGRVGVARALARALAQWVLDYPAESTGEDFRFALPHLDLHGRCVTARRALDAFLRKPPQDRAVRRALDRLGRILGKARSEGPFQAVTASLHRRDSLFNELREALRLRPKCSGRYDPPSAEEAVAEIRNIQEEVEELVASLEHRRPERGPAKDTRKAVDLVLDHLARHGASPWGHVIPLPVGVGEGIRVVVTTGCREMALERGSC